MIMMLKTLFRKIKESMMSVSKLKDVDKIINYFQNSEYISKAYISNVDTSTGMVTLNLNSSDELYNKVLREVMGDINYQGSLLKVFAEYAENKEETNTLKQALKWSKQLDMELFIQLLRI